MMQPESQGRRGLCCETRSSLTAICPKAAAAGAGSGDPPDKASGHTSPGSAVSGCECCSQWGNYTDGKGPPICFSELGGWGNRGNGEEERTQPQTQSLDQKTFRPPSVQWCVLVAALAGFLPLLLIVETASVPQT